MKHFRDYDVLYPYLIVDLLEYFNPNNKGIQAVKDRSVIKFCQGNNGATGKDPMLYQPDTVDKICHILCEHSILNIIKKDGGLGLNNNYLFLPENPTLFSREKERLAYYFNSMVYGFEYVYRLYKNLVIPLIWETADNDYYMGTGFLVEDGIVTAKHCIQDAKNLKIKGFMADELNDCNIYISDNPGVDIAFICTGRVANPRLYFEEGQIMQEVLVMGYPRIPAFTDFLTAEKATISSKAEARITPTKGSIAAYGHDYLASIEAMLVTARIKGGNSGGPVINKNGCLVGVACKLPCYEKNVNQYYDDLGYGIVIPVKHVANIMDRRSELLKVPKDFFRDYIE